MKTRKLALCFSLVLILVLVASLLLSACAKEQTPATTTPAKPAPTTAAPTTPAKPAPTTAAPTTPAKPAPTPSAQAIKWTFQGTWAKGTIKAAELHRMADLVNVMSQGRLAITVHDAGEIIGSDVLADAVASGLVDGGNVGTYFKGMLGSVNEVVAGSNNPLTYLQSQALWEDRGLLDLVRKVFSGVGIFYCGPQYHGDGEFIYSRTPLNSPADLKGKKMRSSGFTAQVVTSLGASTVWLPWEELYTAAATGVVDVCEWGDMDTMYVMGLQEVMKYWYRPACVNTNTNNVVNLGVWNKLPPDLQQVVLVAWENSSAWGEKGSNYQQNLVVPKLVQAGVTVSYWDAAGMSVWANAIASVMKKLGATGDKYAIDIYNVWYNYVTFLGLVK